MSKPVFLNDMDVPLSTAVWLAADDYDFTPTPNAISATDLLKSDRQLVLRKRRMEMEVAAGGIVTEPIPLSGRVAARMGHAIHSGIEHSWNTGAAQALIDLGYPKKVAQQVTINPTDDQLAQGCIPVYMEIRNTKEIEGWTISGQFDFVIEGALEDFKSTSVFTYVNQTNTDKYIKQGSIYRWLNPEIVTDDVFKINYIFTDWSKNMARSSDKYPKQRIVAQPFNLMSVSETEHFIKSKLRRVAACSELPEADLPDCNDEELWMKAPVYKFYKNPETAAKGGRSSKNFDSKLEAAAHQSKTGGVVIEVPGQVVACKYAKRPSDCVWSTNNGVDRGKSFTTYGDHGISPDD